MRYTDDHCTTYEPCDDVACHGAPERQYVPLCECGWDGDHHPSASEAITEAERHVFAVTGMTSPRGY